jgi:outer membrane protein TolC
VTNLAKQIVALFTCTLGLCVVPRPSFAEPLTRHEALRLALQQNPQVAAARAKEAGARARGDQVDAARFPEVTLTVGLGPGLTAHLVPGTAVQSTENAYGDVGLDDVSLVVGSQLNVVQPIYTFGKIGRREDATGHDLSARRAQTRMTRAQLALEVADIYEGLLFAHAAVLFFEDVSYMLDGAVTSLEERLAGNEPDLNERELLQMQTARHFVVLQLNRAQASVREAEAGLRAYLGQPAETKIELPEEGLEPVASRPSALPELQNLARAARPELAALREGEAALHALADAEAAGALPDIFAMAFASAAYTPGRDLVDTRYVVDPQQHFVPGVLVGARWRWQAGGASARADERRAEADELSHTRAWAEQGIPAEVLRAYEEAERAHGDIATTDAGAKLAKRWVIMAMADNTIGAADSRAVVDSVEAYVTLRVGWMEAKYRYNVWMAKLAAATGSLDRLDGPLYPGKPLKGLEHGSAP